MITWRYDCQVIAVAAAAAAVTPLQIHAQHFFALNLSAMNGLQARKKPERDYGGRVFTRLPANSRVCVKAKVMLLNSLKRMHLL